MDLDDFLGAYGTLFLGIVALCLAPLLLAIAIQRAVAARAKRRGKPTARDDGF
jgi:hypothetical protein